MSVMICNHEKMYTCIKSFATGTGTKKAKSVCPEDADMLFLLKYHIASVLDSVEATIEVFEREMN